MTKIVPLDWRVVILKNPRMQRESAEKWLIEVVGEKDVKWRMATIRIARSACYLGAFGVYAFADFEDAVIFNMTWNGM